MGYKISFDSNTLEIANTREQLIHVWSSFHSDENAETMDSYITSIR